MARSILITNERRHVKKAAALAMLRTLFYAWDQYGVSIRRLTVRSTEEIEAIPYIPDKLPPSEVPGCFFQEPQSPTWRMQHRGGAIS